MHRFHFLFPYARLMRLHQPVGIWLLLWPCWWAVALASPEFPSLKILLLFAIGAILMRSAGCILNDMADRKIDRQVERTMMRPLASGEVTLMQAMLLLLLLLALSLLVALMLGKAVLLWAVLSLIPVTLYPFMKRISWWPQFFLGLTFNWGALMGWAAIRGEVEIPALLLYVGGIFWTLGYDTIYAHQDKADDARIGVKSTALRLGQNTLKAVAGFYALCILCWSGAGIAAGGMWHLPFMALVAWHFCSQLRRVDVDNPISCRLVFVSNARLGAIVFLGIIASKIF